MNATVHTARSGRLIVWFGGGWYALRFRRLYVSLRGPAHRPLFTERNRIGCRVLPLWRGWRIVVHRRAWR